MEREKADAKRAVVLLNKSDVNKAEENSEVFFEFYQNKFNTLKISTVTALNIETLKHLIFENLDIIRVYTKKIGHPPVKREPIVLKAGSTVIEAAEHIHKDFKHNLKFTRLWNDKGFNGQRVEKNYILHDGDIVEFHV
uniref:TGS domain-containing protein n=1 Tax=candidate division WOR-3 bacterium TaxID=2052148 RepID=A0A7C6AFB0_UNCW3